MERRYVSKGNKVISIVQLDNVVAVKLFGAPENTRRNLGVHAERPSDPIGKTDWLAFEEDGWNFFKPSEVLMHALVSHIPPRGVDAMQNVFRRQSGRILI